MKLDDRKFLILQAIIDDYIMTAVPVGSRTISRKSGVGFSAATIRNEMSDLEELGYLDQPHTSSGRVPSAKAYRLYVDRLMEAATLTEEDRSRIQNHLEHRAAQAEEVIRQAAQALSDITQYTAVVLTPQINSMTVRRVQLVPVTERSALMIVVTGGGLVRDSVIQIPEGIEPDHLYGLSKLITARLEGCAMGGVAERLTEMFSDLTEHRQLMSNVLNVLSRQLDEEPDTKMVIGGGANLLNYPEYSDVEKAKNFLAVLESKEKLYPLLRQAGGLEFTVRIGPENELPELSDCSVVTATYRMGRKTAGTMSIIGPTRMHYARVVSVMNYMGKLLGDMLSGEKE